MSPGSNPVFASVYDVFGEISGSRAAETGHVASKKRFSDKTYALIQRSCSREELVHGVQSEACRSALEQMDRERGPQPS